MEAARTMFDRLVERYVGRSGVEPPEPGGRRFGSNALKVNGSIFAMSMDGAIVLKLPADRVASLIAEGAGKPFGAGKGRPMREWVSLTDTADAEALTEEAYEFGRTPTSASRPRSR